MPLLYLAVIDLVDVDARRFGAAAVEPLDALDHARDRIRARRDVAERIADAPLALQQRVLGSIEDAAAQLVDPGVVGAQRLDDLIPRRHRPLLVRRAWGGGVYSVEAGSGRAPWLAVILATALWSGACGRSRG